MVLMLRLNKSRHSDLVTMLRAALLDLNDQKYIYIKWLLDCTSWLLHAVVCKVHGDIFFWNFDKPSVSNFRCQKVCLQLRSFLRI